MPLMTLHATIELYPEDPGLDFQVREDLKTLSRHFPQSPQGSARLAATAPLAPSPFSELRVAWEFNQGEIEAVIVKVMTGVFSGEDAKAREFLYVLEDILPALGPQIVTALAHGIVHIGFDVNAEGWRYPAPSAHEKMRQIREAERTLRGRNAPGIAGDLQETYDPDGLPALLAQCPLPGIDP